MTKTTSVHLQTLCFLLITLLLSAFLPHPGADGLPSLPLPAATKAEKAAARISNGIKGIDASEYQGKIDWKRVANDGVEFAFLRASIGETEDKTFKYNAQHAHKNGIDVGAYHYAKFSNVAGAKREAAFFLKTISSAELRYPVVLDLEAHRGVSKAKLTQAALAFMETVESAGYRVMFYSYENFFGNHVNTSALKKYPFWVANYITKPTKVSHQVWQYTCKGRVDGISTYVDLNVAYESLARGRQIVVNKTHSDTVKSFLNDTYGTAVSIDRLVISEVRSALVTGLQKELNAQFGAGLRINGELDSKTLSALRAVSISPGEEGSFAALIQSALFYRGYYTGSPSGRLDEATMQALEEYRSQNRAAQGSDANLLAHLFRT